MSNLFHFHESKKENLKENSSENKSFDGESILEKINNQINFLKNKFEVSKIIDSDQFNNPDFDISLKDNLNNQTEKTENSQDVLKLIREEK